MRTNLASEAAAVVAVSPDTERLPHLVQFYENDSFLEDEVARFVGAGLGAGDAIVIIATRAHLRAIEGRLTERGMDVGLARDQRWFYSLDAHETLAQLLVDDRLNAARFKQIVGGIIAKAALKRTRVRAFGEMVAILWEEQRRDAAIQLESFWNDLAATLPFSLLCAYPLGAVQKHEDHAAFLDICGEHSHVIPGESYTTLTAEERLRFVAHLQQRALALDGESEGRKAAEHALEARQEAFDNFFEYAPVAIHSVGADGTILKANHAELTLLGYSAEDYVGHHVREFHVDQVAIDDILERLARGETIHGYEAPLRCRDGSVKHVRIDSNVLFEEGRFVQTRCFTIDLTDRKRLDEASAHLAAIVESSDDAIVSKDLNGTIMSWNSGAERIFGYTAHEAIGQSITMLLPRDRYDEEPAIIGRVKRGERVEHYETVRSRKDGTLIDISLSVSPVTDSRGNVIGASKIARDISDRKRAERERLRLAEAERKARRDAEAANRAKDEFLSVVSHELRTPLASMLGWVNVLKAGATGEKAARAVETIERSGRLQAKLIDDLLDASRIVTGRMRLDLRLVDLPAIMKQALDAIRPTAEAKGIRLEAELDPSAGPVAGDADRLQQIAWNLLSNAVKFTSAGGCVELRLERRDEDVRLIVRDSGRGISREFLPFIFESFRQADGVASRRTGGLGLGLAIARHLVELHGGTIAATSDGDGCGAAFTVALPFAAAAHPTESAEAPAKRLLGLRVLVVDDNFDGQESIRAVLESCGARVTVAGAVAEACELLRRHLPDVLVSDIRLPDGDGYALVRELRATDRLRHIPAIAVTGHDDGEGIAEAAGYQKRFAKPVEPGALVDAISELVAVGAHAHGMPA